MAFLDDMIYDYVFLFHEDDREAALAYLTELLSREINGCLYDDPTAAPDYTVYTVESILYLLKHSDVYLIYMSESFCEGMNGQLKLALYVALEKILQGEEGLSRKKLIPYYPTTKRELQCNLGPLAPIAGLERLSPYYEDHLTKSFPKHKKGHVPMGPTSQPSGKPKSIDPPAANAPGGDTPDSKPDSPRHVPMGPTSQPRGKPKSIDPPVANAPGGDTPDSKPDSSRKDNEPDPEGDPPKITSVDSQWNLASEGPSNNDDELGYDVYADAFVELVRDERVSNGTTIGVYGSWGAGKTFLLNRLSEKCKQIESNAKKESQPPSYRQMKTRLCCRFSCNICAYLTLLAFVVLGFGITAGGLVLGLGDENNTTGNGSATNSPTVLPQIYVMSSFGGFVVIVILFALIKCCCISGCKMFDEFFKLLLLVFFKQPSQQRSTTDNKSTPSNLKVIETRFNAWEFSGSDHLWAGIVTNICNVVEQEFGFWKTRLFRFVEGKATDTEQSRAVKGSFCFRSCCVSQGTERDYSQVPTDDNKTTGVQPNSGSDLSNVLEERQSCLRISCYFTFFLIISILIFSVTVIIHYAQTTPPATREQLLFGVALVGLVTALIPIINTTVGLISSLCQSEAERVVRMKRHLTRSNFDEELGFMNRIKLEVYFIKDFIRYMEYIYQTDYRLLIIIDDLDRVEKDKIHKILEAVNILFSDNTLPFISLVAIDPLIIVKAIEQSYPKVLLNANINGHEYLKKIIHLPFCIPLPTDEPVKQYVNAMVKTEKSSNDVRNDSKVEPEHFERGPVHGIQMNERKPGGGTPSKSDEQREVENASLRTAMDGLRETSQFLAPNARNIKRIRNILMATFKLVMRGEKMSDKEIHELARWVLFTEQWPYRASWLIHICEKREHTSETELLTLYEECEKELAKPSDWKALLSLDHNPRLFKLFLKKYKFKMSDVKKFLPVTVNLDYTIRTIIVNAESEKTAKMYREQLKSKKVGKTGENQSTPSAVETTRPENSRDTNEDTRASAKGSKYDYVVLFHENERKAALEHLDELQRRGIKGCLYDDPAAPSYYRECNGESTESVYLLETSHVYFVYMSKTLCEGMNTELNSNVYMYTTLNRILSSDKSGKRLILYYPTTKEDLTGCNYGDLGSITHILQRQSDDYENQLSQLFPESHKPDTTTLAGVPTEEEALGHCFLCKSEIWAACQTCLRMYCKDHFDESCRFCTLSDNTEPTV